MRGSVIVSALFMTAAYFAASPAAFSGAGDPSASPAGDGAVRLAGGMSGGGGGMSGGGGGMSGGGMSGAHFGTGMFGAASAGRYQPALNPGDNSAADNYAYPENYTYQCVTTAGRCSFVAPAWMRTTSLKSGAVCVCGGGKAAGRVE